MIGSVRSIKEFSLEENMAFCISSWSTVILSLLVGNCIVLHEKEFIGNIYFLSPSIHLSIYLYIYLSIYLSNLLNLLEFSVDFEIAVVAVVLIRAILTVMPMQNMNLNVM